MQAQLKEAAATAKASDRDWEARVTASVSSAEQWKEYGDEQAGLLAQRDRQLQVRMRTLGYLPALQLSARACACASSACT